MKKNGLYGMSALSIVGIVFSILGAVYTILGVILWNVPSLEGEDALVGPIFFGIGCLFLVLGVIFLMVEQAKKKQTEALIAGGRYIWGELTEFVPNYNVRVNGRNPYVAVVRYRDAQGIIHVFRSRNLRVFPDTAAIGKQVKVYIKDDSFKPYFVDLTGVMRHVVEH